MTYCFRSGRFSSSSFSSRVRPLVCGLALAVLALATAPAAAQDVIVDDDGQAALPTNCGGTGSVDDTIQDGIATASSGQTVFVCPGTYAENVTVNKSVTLQGNNVGTAGNGARSSSESIIDAGTGATDAGVTVAANNVTLDGLQFKGSVGVLVDGDLVANVTGLAVQNNRFRNDRAGASITNVSNAGTGSFDINNNLIDLTQQFADSGTDGNADADATAPTAGFNIRTLDLATPPSFTNNFFQDTDGDNLTAYYGIIFDGVNGTSGTNSDGPATITGGTISGTAQAIAILDGENGAGGTLSDGTQALDESGFAISGVTMNGFTGDANNVGAAGSLSDNDDIDFHAGVFVYTGGDSGEPVASPLTTTGTIDNVVIEDVGLAGGNGTESSGLYFGGFSEEFGGDNFAQQVTATNVTIQNGLGRGVFSRGGLTDATVTQSTIENMAQRSAGDVAVSVKLEKGGGLTLTESFVRGPSSVNGTAGPIIDANNSTAGSSISPIRLAVESTLIERNISTVDLARASKGSAPAFTANLSANAYVDATGPGVLTTATDINNLISTSSATIDFNPFLNSLTDTDTGTAGFQGDFSRLTATTAGDQIGAFGANQRIAEGIDAVDSGGTVIVEADTFEENLIITKSNVTVEGAQAGTAANTTRGTESTVTPATSDGTTGVVIDVQASNVTLDGLEIDANNSNLSGGADAAIGVLMDASTTTGLSGVTVQNTIVRNIPSLNTNPAGGIVGIGSSSGNVIRQNLLTNFGAFNGSTTPESTNAGIGLRGNFFATVENNTSDNVAFGILMYTHDASASAAPQTVSGGTHSNNYRGIVVYPGQANSEYLIDGVTTSNNQQHGITLFRFNGFGVQGTGTGANTVDATIQNATVTDNQNVSGDASGINVSGSVAGGQYSVVIEDSDILDNQNRGVNARATDDTSIDVTVRRSNLLGNGHTPDSPANANGAIAQRGAVLTIENSVINNSNSATSTNATDADAVASKSEAGAGDRDVGQVTITNSQILAPVGQAAVLAGPGGSGDPGFLNASGNWWDGTDPAAFALVDAAGTLDYSPFLESGTDTDGATAGFQGDFSALAVDSGSEQIGPTTRFAEAIAQGTSGSTLRAIASNTLIASGAEFTIPSGGVILNGDLIVDGDLTFATGSGSITVPGELIVDPGVTSLTNSPTFIVQNVTEGTAGFGSAGNPGPDAGWRMFAIPRSAGDGTVLSDNLDFSTQVGTILYTFDESTQDYVAGDGTSGTSLPSGRGFFLYLFDDDLDPIEPSDPLTLDAAGTLDVGTPFPTGGSIGTADLDVSLADVSSAPTAADGSKVHLLGNPFAQSFDLSNLTDAGTALGGNNEFLAAVQVWDPETTSYEVVNVDNSGSTDLIAPWQGFWVERDPSGTGDAVTLTFESGGRSQGAPFIPATSRVAAQTGRIELDVALEDASGTVVSDDRSILYFRTGLSVGSDSYDATKYAPFINSGEYVQLAFQDADNPNRSLVQTSLPYEVTERIAIPTHINAVNLSGTAVVSLGEQENVPEEWTVFLTDTQTDESVALDPGMEHRFDLGSTTMQTAARSLGPSPVAARAASDARFVVTVSPDGTLPVELASFEGTVNESDAVLTWRTLTETNNAGFEVQHKAPDAEAFETRRFVEGAGTTSEPQSYRFTVRDLAFGEHTFRLRQVDTDGTASFSDPTTLKIGLSQSHVVRAAYPNPVRQEATLAFAVKESQSVTVSLYNLLGQRVRTLYRDTPTPDTFTDLSIRTDDLASGMYLLRIEGERFADTQRLTVVR